MDRRQRQMTSDNKQLVPKLVNKIIHNRMIPGTNWTLEIEIFDQYDCGISSSFNVTVRTQLQFIFGGGIIELIDDVTI